MNKRNSSQSSTSSGSFSHSLTSFHSKHSIGLEPQFASYQLIRAIGKVFPCNSTVYLGKHEKTEKLVAVKCVDLDSASDDKKLQLYMMEIYMSSMAHHPNISSHLTSFIHSSQIWIVMNYIDKGSARDILDTVYFDGLPESSISSIMRQVVKALLYLHANHIVHRSVKSSHILLDHTGHVYLSGLKYATEMERDGKPVTYINHFCGEGMEGNLYWLSPELLAQHVNGYGYKSDMYSVGIVSCELANGLVPFCEMEATKMFKEKLDGTVPKLIDQSTCPTVFPNGGQGYSDEFTSENGKCRSLLQERVFSKHFHDFVARCLSLNEDERPTAEEALSHSFLKTCVKQNRESLQSTLQPVAMLGQEQMKDSGTFNTNPTPRFTLDGGSFDWEF